MRADTYDGRRWARWGMVFGVERIGARGVWHAVGRRSGKRPYVLDHVEGGPDGEDVQGRLDRWAGRHGLVEVRHKVASGQMCLDL